MDPLGFEPKSMIHRLCHRGPHIEAVFEASSNFRVIPTDWYTQAQCSTFHHEVFRVVLLPMQRTEPATKQRDDRTWRVTAFEFYSHSASHNRLQNEAEQQRMLTVYLYLRLG